MSHQEYGSTGWFDGWQNARQRRAIQGLETEIGSLSSSLHQQRRESAQLRTTLSQLQGTLEVRVNRLASSLEALVELGDVRQVLAMFDGPALVRHWARDAVTAVVDVGTAVEDLPPPPADVPGYWLGPAVQSLVALARGEDASEAIATAHHRDPHRTSLLLATGLILGGRVDLADQWLADALGRFTIGIPVTMAQRALWTTLAAGWCGATGTAVLRQCLTGLVDALTPDQERIQAQAWAQQVDAIAGGGRERASDPPQVRQCLAAGDRLAALRQLCLPVDPPADYGSGAKLPGDQPRAAYQSRTPSAPETPELTGLLTDVLHSLVDEGTAEEAPLLRRTVELRAAVAGSEDAPPGWDGAAGDPGDLLRADAFAPEQPGLARAAQAAQAAGSRWLLAAATALVEATAVDPPASGTVTISGQQVRVSTTGPDEWELSRARTGIEEQPVTDPVADQITRWMAIAGGVLLLVPMLFWPQALAVLVTLAGGGLLVTAGVRWHRERERRTYRSDDRLAALVRLEREVGKAATELARLHQRVATASERAESDLAALRRHLPG